MTKKIVYSVRNWKDYDRSLINRGNLTIWFSDDAVSTWYQKPQKNKKRDRSFIHSDTYIEPAVPANLGKCMIMLIVPIFR